LSEPSGKKRCEHKKPGFGATPRENDKFKNYPTNKNLIDAYSNFHGGWIVEV